MEKQHNFIPFYPKTSKGDSFDVLGFYRTWVLRHLSKYQIFSQSASLPSGKMQLLEGGKGFPILFVHGFGGSALDTWKDQLSFFSKSHRILAPDLYWFGDSVPSHKPFRTPEQHAESLIELMDQKGIQKAHLVGVSFGGYVSLELAKKYPERVSKLVLIDSAGLKPTLLEESKIKDVFDFADGDIVNALLPKNVEHLKLFLQKVFFKPRFFPTFALKQVLTQDFWKNKEEKIQILRFIEKHFLSTEEIQSIQNPTAVFWGKHDRLLPLSMGTRLNSWLPNSILQPFECSGHAPMLEEPRHVNQMMEKFLQK